MFIMSIICPLKNAQQFLKTGPKFKVIHGSRKLLVITINLNRFVKKLLESHGSCRQVGHAAL